MIDSNELENNSTQSSVLCGKSEKITMDISSQNLTVDFNFAECEKAANEQRTGTIKNEVSDISKYLLVQEGSLALKEQKETLKKELAIYKIENSDLANDERVAGADYCRLAALHARVKD